MQCQEYGVGSYIAEERRFREVDHREQTVLEIRWVPCHP